MDAKDSGVVVVYAAVVHAAELVQKTHPYPHDAFSSCEVGPLAWIEGGSVRWSVDTIPLALPHRVALSSTQSGTWLKDETVVNCASARGKVVDALVTHGIQGWVACTANSTVSNALMVSVQRAMAQGVKVVRATRCSLGRVISILDALIPDSQGLSPVKARVALMLSLMLCVLSR